MDYMPKPTNFLSGVDVPLMDIIPACARPTPVDGSHPTFLDNTNTPWIEHTTSWGETYLVPPDHHPRPTSDKTALEDWFAFPRRFGLLKPDDDVGAEPVLLFEQPPVRFATLLQSWAFFGLIQIFCDKHIGPSRDWSCRRTPGDTYTPYVKWPEEFLDLFLSRIKAPTAPTRHGYRQLFSYWLRGPREDRGKIEETQGSNSCIEGSVLEAAVMFSTIVCYHVERSDFALQSPVAEIALSVRALCETLRDRGDGPGTGNALLATLMRGRGWCPSVAAQTTCSSPRGVLQAYYLYTMPPPERSNHTACDAQVCRSSNTVLDTGYETRHTMPRCRCDFVGVDTESLCAIIEKGRIPIIQIYNSEGGPHISITEARPGDEFTAISHIWADGLGNPTRNALPACQVQNIRNRIKNLPRSYGGTGGNAGGTFKSRATIIPGVLRLDLDRYRFLRPRWNTVNGTQLLWMDTLCIPVGDSGRIRNAQVEAIARMNLVYSLAAHVMVLDRYLLNMRLANASFLEMYARIATAPWTQRSWTYQEGALASAPCFEYADGCLSGRTFRSSHPPPLKSHIFYNLTSHPTLTHKKVTWLPHFLIRLRRVYSSTFGGHNFRVSDFPSAMTTLLLDRFHSSAVAFRRDALPLYGSVVEETRRQYSLSIAKLDVLINAWDALARRSTTRQEDQYLIFANLLGYNPRQLLNHPRAERILLMLASMDVLPLRLLFNPGPRYKSDAYHLNRWVPSAISKMPLSSKLSPPLRYTPGPGIVGELLKFHIYRSRPESRFPEAERMRCSNGSLWVQSESAPETTLVIIGDRINRTKITYLEREPGEWWRIECDYNPDTDTFVCADQTCLLLMGPLHNYSEAYGARLYAQGVRECRQEEKDTVWHGLDPIHLLETPPTGETRQFTAIYDCPLRYTRVLSGSVPANSCCVDFERFQVLMHPKAWRLEVKTDISKDYKALVARPEMPRGSSGFFALTAKAVPATLVNRAWFCVYMVLRAVISAQIGWRDTGLLYKVSIFVWLLVPIPPFPEIVFFVARTRENSLRPIDTTWIGLSIGLFYGGIILRALLFYIAATIMFNSWVRSFDTDWPASKSSWQHFFAFDLERRTHFGFNRLRERFSRRVGLLTVLPKAWRKRYLNNAARLSLTEAYPSRIAKTLSGTPSGSSDRKRKTCRCCYLSCRSIRFHCGVCPTDDREVCLKCSLSGKHRELGHWLIRSATELDKQSWMPSNWQGHGLEILSGAYYHHTETKQILQARPWEQDVERKARGRLHLILRPGCLALCYRPVTGDQDQQAGLGSSHPLTVWPVSKAVD